MRLIGRIVCFFKGHKRGKLVGYSTDPQQPKVKIFQCPRCGNVTTYKVKDQNNGTPGDQA